jgi:hypothetical protein
LKKSLRNADINPFLKLKIESSGYPSWVQTPDDQDRYIEVFWQSEGVRLDKNSIKHNVAKRALAKLCLNSTWGKLTERSNRTQTKLISDPQELYRFLATPGIEVTGLFFAGNAVVWVSWRHSNEEHVPNLRHVNEIIGSFVTAGARIHLYRYVDKLQDKAFYCDTDSVIYIQPRDEPALVETGDNLGAMSSELKPGVFIQEYVSGGPKNYAYKTVNSVIGEQKTVCKLRGITLNYRTLQLVNFDTIKVMIMNRDMKETITVHTSRKIKRKTGREGDGRINIISEPENKIYRVSFLKRMRLADNTSVPLGYINREGKPVRYYS